MADQSKKKPTVVMVHGLARTSASMRIFAMRLHRAGFETADTRYRSTRLTLREATASVTKQVEKIAARAGGPVHLVGHSLGGVIALRIKKNRPELVHRVVQLGSPNRGSGLADALKDSRLVSTFFGPVLSELSEDLSDDWTRDPDVAAFAGIEIPSRLSRVYGVLGPNDGMVSVRSAWGRDAGVRLTASTFHGGMPLSASVARATVAFLKRGAPGQANG